MDTWELLSTLTKEYEGTLLIAEGKREAVSVKFTSGALPFTARFEIFVLDKETEEHKLFLFRRFTPVAELLLRSWEPIEEEVVEELRKQVADGLLSFMRFKDKYSAELLTVSAGILEKRGVFYYPEQNGAPVPLIEVKENGITVYYENLESVRGV